LSQNLVILHTFTGIQETQNKFMTQFYDPRHWGNVGGACGRIGGWNMSLLQEQMGVV